MSERPFMQFYPSDFIGDTMTLTTEQIGAYMLLLMTMWNAGGKLPNDDRKLARITRITPQKWHFHKPELMAFFEASDDGYITHSRLNRELEKTIRKSEKRSECGAIGGAAKALKDKEAALAKATVLPQHLPDTITRKKEDANASKARAKKTDPEFEEWYGHYPHKVQRGEAERAFVKARLIASLEDLIAGVQRYVASKPVDRQWLNPATWLNRKSWLDAPAPVFEAVRATAPPSQQRTMNDALEDIKSGKLDVFGLLNGKSHEPAPPTIDASFERTDRGGFGHPVQIHAISSGRRS